MPEVALHRHEEMTVEAIGIARGDPRWVRQVRWPNPPAISARELFQRGHAETFA